MSKKTDTAPSNDMLTILLGVQQISDKELRFLFGLYAVIGDAIAKSIQASEASSAAAHSREMEMIKLQHSLDMERLHAEWRREDLKEEKAEARHARRQADLEDLKKRVAPNGADADANTVW
jgi:hypothetical protein